MTRPEQSAFGALFVRLRKRRFPVRADFARALHVTPGAPKAWENGAAPARERVAQIIGVLGLDAADAQRLRDAAAAERGSRKPEVGPYVHRGINIGTATIYDPQPADIVVLPRYDVIPEGAPGGADHGNERYEVVKELAGDGRYVLRIADANIERLK